VSFVVEFEQRWAVRVFLLQMNVVYFGLVGRVTALFANVHLQNNTVVRTVKSGVPLMVLFFIFSVGVQEKCHC